MRGDRVFAMLIESGFLYCCLWVCPPTSRSAPKWFTCVAFSQIFYLISVFGVLPEIAFAVMGSGLLFVSVCVPPFCKFSWLLKYTDLAQGLYPTLIVILVGMQMSPVEYYSTHSTGIQFASGPSPVPSSMPQHAYRTGHEYVSDSETQVPSAVFMKISDEEKSLSVG